MLLYRSPAYSIPPLAAIIKIILRFWLHKPYGACSIGINTCSLRLQPMQFTGIPAAAERINQKSRCARNAAEMDMVSGFDNLHRLICGYKTDISVVIHSFS